MRSHGRSAIVLLVFAACHSAPPVAQRAGRVVSTAPKSPLSQAELPTTDGAIALSNLQGQIDGEERLATFGPLTVKQRAGIAELVGMRGQFLGCVADYERAEVLADQLTRDMPNDPASFVARAKARSTFHRFADALADLDEAERLGMERERNARLRAAILQATARYDEAVVIRRREVERRPDITSLGAEASLYADRGEIDEAERLFIEAQYHYRDVSPFPVVWLYFQQGLMWMREGNLERARELFAAAQERLPAYATAQGHLAEVEAALGNRNRAIRLLRPLAETSDDPDYATQLARILAEAGQSDEARRWRDVAAKRYEELLTRHPEAFADHAAEFWLIVGGDPQKALALAQRNRENRPTPQADELVLQSAIAAGDTATACHAAEHARTWKHQWPHLRALTAQTLSACAPS